ncbi:hypothetical protein DFH29DRAFT_875322 [Suillus ampliporus]|nr:hypothetical protein DFH29DRAFT_875322 [Suillus ampliporus]
MGNLDLSPESTVRSRMVAFRKIPFINLCRPPLKSANTYVAHYLAAIQALLETYTLEVQTSVPGDATDTRATDVVPLVVNTMSQAFDQVILIGAGYEDVIPLEIFNVLNVKGRPELPIWGTLDFTDANKGVAGAEKDRVPYLQWGKGEGLGGERRRTYCWELRVTEWVKETARTSQNAVAEGGAFVPLGFAGYSIRSTKFICIG